MLPNDRPFGPDTLVVPAYLANGADDPGLAAWTLHHPDCFEAGTWTPRSGDSGRQRDAARNVGRGRDLAPLDPATISVADFTSVAVQAKQTPTPAPDRPTPDAPA